MSTGRSFVTIYILPQRVHLIERNWWRQLWCCVVVWLCSPMVASMDPLPPTIKLGIVCCWRIQYVIC